MSKSKLRIKILNLRKKYSYKKLNIFPGRIYQFLKKNKINFKNVGGYYPCNHEIDDLDMLNFLYDLFFLSFRNLTLSLDLFTDLF